MKFQAITFFSTKTIEFMRINYLPYLYIWFTFSLKKKRGGGVLNVKNKTKIRPKIEFFSIKWENKKIPEYITVQK